MSQPGGPCGQALGQWPPRTGAAPWIRFDSGSKLLETKFGQDSKNQFDGGQKGGEQLKVLIRGYFVGKLPIMKHLLAWAERHGTVPISETMVLGLKPHLD